ncbi:MULTISPECIES: phage portal protein [unclassified Psychrobacter]|uniref:phage portal protein n=1 Tax=unclassified Psychrobacter TaxID=196806 RepID=UPI000869AA47|nr:phage portal protein [Psychrobacter sp. B29-1]OEH68532.1 MAG: phage portal protein [Psychrobacter sp. B29-1]
MGKFIDWMTGKKSASTAQPVTGGDVWHTIHEPSTGAWQRNQEIEVSKNDQMRHHAVFACVSLITRDIGKLKIKAKKKIDGVSQDCDSNVKKLLAKPNHYQNTQQFFEAWVSSKSTSGNTYVLKVRNIYGEIWQLLILNPERTKPLVDPNGNVFYQVRRDRLFNLDDDIIIPASEIIHDRYNCFYHPLVGLSPITACALSASQGINIQRNAAAFFANASRPSGILVTPGSISPENAKQMKDEWNSNYSGTGTGRTGVLGDGVTYQSISIAAQDAQLVEQLKLSGEIVCTSFSVPAFKVGLGPAPAGKVSDLNDIYYSDCLQHYIESAENLLNQHLDLEDGVEVEFCLDALLRMDAGSQMDYLDKGVKGAIMSPNEARAKIGLAAVPGGESPMIQQQNFSLAAIAKRDSSPDPFAKAPAPTPTDEQPKGDDDGLGNA